MTILGRLFDRLNRLVLKRLSGRPISLDFTSEGITITDTHDDMTIPWPRIERIATFKQDLHAYDRVCLLIESDGHAVELNEEMDGFAECFGAFERNLNVSPDWSAEVGFPAFETKPSIIYQKHAQEGVVHE